MYINAGVTKIVIFKKGAIVSPKRISQAQWDYRTIFIYNIILLVDKLKKKHT